MSNPLKVPQPGTLKRYGLSLAEWEALAKRQNYVCAVCGLAPNGELCIDHEHAKGWRYRPPHERKLYVRCLACTACNYRLMPRGMTRDKALRIAQMLSAYEARRPNLPPPQVRRKKKRRRSR